MTCTNILHKFFYPGIFYAELLEKKLEIHWYKTRKTQVHFPKVLIVTRFMVHFFKNLSKTLFDDKEVKSCLRMYT